jgi:ABC-type Zn uptake system ZnuABC Zn-binding protein ZnuA
VALLYKVVIVLAADVFLVSSFFVLVAVSSLILNENTISEVKKLIRNGQIKYIYSASETTNDTCKNLIDNYGVELVTINTMESIDGNVSNSNENYVTIMNNNLELFNKELYK